MTTSSLGELRDAMKELLESGRVRTVIGWEQGTNAFRSRPGFFRSADQIDRAIFSPACSPSLVRMLIEDLRYPLDGPEDRRALGIVLRGCDDKGVIELLKERQILREGVVLIGVDCPGVVDWTKVRSLVKEAVVTHDDLVSGQLIWRERDIVLLTANGEIGLDAHKVMMDKCLECEGHTPRIFDRMIGEPDLTRAPSSPPEKVIELEEADPAGRWAFWEEVFSRCIRCFACRNICTYCFCEECAVDPTTLAISDESSAADKANRPEWVGRETTVPANAVYLATRAYHGAGRCTGCEECDRACPMRLPLRLLNRKVRKDAKELFDYEAGREVEDRPLLGDARDTDPGGFIW